MDGHVPLDEAEHFLHNRGASVATLGWCSGSSGMQSILSSVPTNRAPALLEGGRCLRVRCAKPLRSCEKVMRFQCRYAAAKALGGARSSANVERKGIA
jgi:hypothetical protein